MHLLLQKHHHGNTYNQPVRCPWASPCDDLELLRSECPGLLKAELHRRDDMFLSHPPASRRLDLLLARGRYWYVSRRKVVISSNSWQDIIFRANGVSDPVGFTVATLVKNGKYERNVCSIRRTQYIPHSSLPL